MLHLSGSGREERGWFKESLKVTNYSFPNPPSLSLSSSLLFQNAIKQKAMAVLKRKKA